MPIVVENDETKFSARPAAIVANIRSGGTFLAHCLSNHPQIFCDRAESLHHTSLWHTHLTANRVKLLYCLTHMQGYRVSMCKLTYHQAFSTGVWEYLVETQPLTIWLRRENVVRQAVSVLLNQMAREGQIERPQHTFAAIAPARVTLEPKLVARSAKGLLALDERMRERSAVLGKRMELTYAELIGGEMAAADEIPEGTARRLCAFLDVREMALGCELKRVNAASLRETVENWDEVAAELKRGALAQWVDEV